MAMTTNLEEVLRKHAQLTPYVELISFSKKKKVKKRISSISIHNVKIIGKWSYNYAKKGGKILPFLSR
jgi:hypothetical protein